MEITENSCENCLFIFQNGKRYYEWIEKSCNRCLNIMYNFRRKLNKNSLELKELDKMINEFKWLYETMSSTN